MDREPQPGKERVRKSPKDREMNNIPVRRSIQAGFCQAGEKGSIPRAEESSESQAWLWKLSCLHPEQLECEGEEEVGSIHSTLWNCGKTYARQM